MTCWHWKSSNLCVYVYIYIVDHMEVSENGGTRKSSILIGSIINHPFTFMEALWDWSSESSPQEDGATGAGDRSSQRWRHQDLRDFGQGGSGFFFVQFCP